MAHNMNTNLTKTALKLELKFCFSPNANWKGSLEGEALQVFIIFLVDVSLHL